MAVSFFGSTHEPAESRPRRDSAGIANRTDSILGPVNPRGRSFSSGTFWRSYSSGGEQYIFLAEIACPTAYNKRGLCRT